MPDAAACAAPTFAGFPRGGLDDLAGARVVVYGADEGSPYHPGEPSHAAGAAAAIRRASAGLPARQHDFDLDAVLLGPDDGAGLVDAGDISTSPSDPEGNRERIAAATRTILAAGAVPILLGGDDSVPIPMFRAWEGRGPITIVQVDAHVDWGDVIKGNPLGYGSTMRRAAEMPWVAGMVQVGIRGLGSGTADQIADARAWGSRLVTMRAWRREGVAAALEGVPHGADVVLAVDADGLDPSIMPAVGMPGPGGLLYGDVLDLMLGVAARARIAGMAFVEYAPGRDDPHRLSALTAARVVLTAAGLASRQPVPATGPSRGGAGNLPGL